MMGVMAWGCVGYQSVACLAVVVVWALKSDQGDLIGSGCKNQLLTTMTELRKIRGRIVSGKILHKLSQFHILLPLK